jgi:tetratricopeptide (TPR) repeat protein
MTQAETGARTLLDRLWQAHRAGVTGALEYEVAGRPRKIHLEAGEIHLSPDSPWAAPARELADASERTRWEGLLVKLLQSYLEGGTAQGLTLRLDARMPAGAVGPLPTEALLRRAFALTTPPPPPTELLLAEDGPRGRDRAPLCLAPEESWALERLRRPMRIAELERDCPFEIARLRSALAGLLAVGRIHRPESAPATPQDSGLLRLVELLSARIGASLRDRPLGVLDDALQRRLVSLVAQAEAMDHYQLLGVAADADEAAVQAAFENLARQVHPSHSERPAVGVPRPALVRLFERAVAALRTLGDPALRAAYDATHGVERPVVAPESDRRREEKVELARREFDRARYEELNGDLHSAMVLYEQVVELDQRPEYLLALAHLQAKNPAWTERALATCKRAIELDPERAESRYLAGELYERLGQAERAAALYQAAARSNPPHAGAQAALRRLAAHGVKTEATRGGGPLGRLFRRG